LNLLVKELILLGLLISKRPRDQKYMFLRLKTPFKTIFGINLAQIALAAFAILAGLVASGSVILNDLYFWVQSAYYINPYLCLIAFLLAFSPRVWGLMAIIFLLPLSAGLGTQLNAYLGAQFLILPNAGLDLAAGFFLGSTVKVMSAAPQLMGKKQSQTVMNLMKVVAPWPITLVIVMITISTAIAISRNVYQSAAATSFKGLLFNLVHFRPIGWHDDYMPISDWIAYALAVAMIVLVIGQLKGREDKTQIIFRPVMAGLIVAFLMGISQAITGLGLPDNLLNFRKDHLGYAVIGFQPDLHAFAGHMLLGAVGLWGYFYSGISRHERKLVALVVALSWVGLILSKSRALLLIAVVAMLIWLIWSLWQKKSRFFLPSIAILAAAISILVALIFNYSNSFGGIPVLSWLGELANEFKSRDLTSWSLFSGIFGSRFEIWEAAIRMWWEFPLMGIGQGNFYRLSDIASFSKSHFLILNRGENAHNYFLQTLTETGLIGIAVFSLALLMPLIRSSNKKVLLPAVIALLGLFLGNIFSHSLLVRENLLIATVFSGLLYSQCSSVLSKYFFQKLPYCRAKNYLILSLCATIGLLLFMEIYRSYGKIPFTYGFYCYQKEPLTEDGWTKGAFQMPIPLGSRGINLTFMAPELKNDSPPIEMNFQLRHVKRNQYGYNDTIDSITQTITINHENNMAMNIQFSDKNVINKLDNIELEVRISSCYSPRNLGDSIDSRLLGVKIKSIQAYQ
jgi:hypothetical protein